MAALCDFSGRDFGIGVLKVNGPFPVLLGAATGPWMILGTWLFAGIGVLVTEGDLKSNFGMSATAKVKSVGKFGTST